MGGRGGLHGACMREGVRMLKGVVLCGGVNGACMREGVRMRKGVV